MTPLNGTVAIVTGAGGGVGRHYAKALAKNGATVLVNDVNCDNADIVVKEIIQDGGSAAANYDSVEHGDKIVASAVELFGTVHLLVNNAIVFRSGRIEHSTDQDWDLLNKVNVFGTYKCTRACWPIFRKQKFGRIVNITSLSALFPTPDFSIYASTKLGIVGFSSSLAKEGAKYNILVNTIAPIISNNTLTKILPERLTSKLQPSWAAGFVVYLCRKDLKNVSGRVFQVGGGRISEARMERAAGAKYKCDESLTSSAILKLWGKINDFSEPDYPSNIFSKDFLSILQETSNYPQNTQGDNVDLKGKVAVITGAGGGLGQAYALLFGRMGAKVVVNDVVNPDGTIKSLKAMGAEAVPDRNSVEDGEKIIATAIKHFGTVHILVNNAGILRDKSFNSMEDTSWTDIYTVHVTGTYKCIKAAWPYFLNQNYGRIVNTCSASGLYGNFGQTNYSAAKMSILGLSLPLSMEGKKHGIKINVLAPNAGTNMTRTIMAEEYVKAFKPDYIAPFVALLASNKCPDNGKIYEVGSAWAGRVRWQCTEGYLFDSEASFTVDNISNKWTKITSFDERFSSYPNNAAEALQTIMFSQDKSNSHGQVNKLPSAVKTTKFSYTKRDVILYNISVGATKDQLSWVYEHDKDFKAIPTFGVIPQLSAMNSLDFTDVIPHLNMMKLLHGEHCLEILADNIPTSASLVSEASIIDVADKGNAANLVAKVVTKTKDGKKLFVNQSLLSFRDAGGFGGPKKNKERGFASLDVKAPSRDPDEVASEKTSPNQAALYRLNGDYNPLHIDPSWKIFDRPILHGLCSLGISGRQIVQTYGPISKIKCRFSGHVFPGETLKTEMWKEGDKVIFQTVVPERNSIVIKSAIAQLTPKGSTPSQPTSNTSQGTNEGSASSEDQELVKGLLQLPEKFKKLSQEDQKAILQANKGVYELDISSGDNKTKKWSIIALDDFKVLQGDSSQKPDCKLILRDVNLKKILDGKASAMKLYLEGKMRIEGNLLKSQKLGKIFEKLN